MGRSDVRLTAADRWGHQVGFTKASLAANSNIRQRSFCPSRNIRFNLVEEGRMVIEEGETGDRRGRLVTEEGRLVTEGGDW